MHSVSLHFRVSLKIMYPDHTTYILQSTAALNKSFAADKLQHFPVLLSEIKVARVKLQCNRSSLFHANQPHSQLSDVQTGRKNEITGVGTVSRASQRPPI